MRAFNSFRIVVTSAWSVLSQDAERCMPFEQLACVRDQIERGRHKERNLVADAS